MKIQIDLAKMKLGKKSKKASKVANNEFIKDSKGLSMTYKDYQKCKKGAFKK
jgi:hypothetical protein